MSGRIASFGGSASTKHRKPLLGLVALALLGGAAVVVYWLFGSGPEGFGVRSVAEQKPTPREGEVEELGEVGRLSTLAPLQLGAKYGFWYLGVIFQSPPSFVSFTFPVGHSMVRASHRSSGFNSTSGDS